LFLHGYHLAPCLFGFYYSHLYSYNQESSGGLLGIGTEPLFLGIKFFFSASRAGVSLSAFVNLTAMANGENQDYYFLVLYVAQHPVVANSISPEAGPLTSQRFSKMPGVFASLDPVIEPS
jgi:hypothetical protein